MEGQASLNIDNTISLNVTMNIKEARVLRDLMQNPNEKASDIEENIQEFIFLVMKSATDMDYNKVFPRQKQWDKYYFVSYCIY